MDNIQKHNNCFNLHSPRKETPKSHVKGPEGLRVKLRKYVHKNDTFKYRKIS
jgi:hypothetical protein